MIFTELKLRGAYTIDLERRSDSRGFFARAFCQREFEHQGLEALVAQVNVGFSIRKGTLRGMHFQFPPHSEVKVVRATQGAVLDVIVDLRPESSTYLEHLSVELSADNHRALYIPRRFAHGYQTLEDGSEVSYQTSEFYAPAAESGLSPLDSRLGIAWPLVVSELSDKDRNARRLDEVEPELNQRMTIGEIANT